MSRRKHFVGMVPCATPEAGLRTVLSDGDGRGDRDVDTMSDTESTDGRADYIIPTLTARTQHPNIVALKGLHYYDRDTFHLWNTCVCIRRPGRLLTDDAMSLPYARHAAEWFPVWERVVADLGLPDIEYQVDVAAPFTMSAFTWGPGALHHYDDEVGAAVRQIEQVLTITRKRVVFQISAPVETVLTAWTPDRGQELQAWAMAKRIVALAAAAPAGTKFIIHLCVGRPRGKPVTTLADTAAVTALINAIWAQWPAGQTLNGIHFPVGDVTNPAPTDPAYYYALRGLILPRWVDLIAGIANLAADDDAQRVALREAEQAASRELAVSTPCGLGPDSTVVTPTLARLRDLSTMPATPYTGGPL
jgi:hypothetical protein